MAGTRGRGVGLRIYGSASVLRGAKTTLPYPLSQESRTYPPIIAGPMLVISEPHLDCNDNISLRGVVYNEPVETSIYCSPTSSLSQICTAAAPAIATTINHHVSFNFSNTPVLLTKPRETSPVRHRRRGPIHQFTRRHHPAWTSSRWRLTRLAERLCGLLHLLRLPGLHQLLRRATGVLWYSSAA